MKKYILSLIFASFMSGQAFAFNLDPVRYEFVGQNNDGCGMFYDLNSVKSVGDKASFVMVEANPKNRTLRYYYNTIDPKTMTVVNTHCELFDYTKQPLDNYVVSSKPAKFDEGSISDIIYKDMVAKKLIVDPRKVVVSEQSNNGKIPPGPIPIIIPTGTVTDIQVQKLTGGTRVVVDIQDNTSDMVISNTTITDI